METSTTGSATSVYTEHKVYWSLFKLFTLVHLVTQRHLKQVWADRCSDVERNIFVVNDEQVYWKSVCVFTKSDTEGFTDINTFISRSYPLSHFGVWDKAFITTLCLSTGSSWRKSTVTKTVLSRRRSWRFGSKTLRRSTFTTAWSISGKTSTWTTTVWSAGRSTRTSRTGVTWVNTQTHSLIHIEHLISRLITWLILWLITDHWWQTTLRRTQSITTLTWCQGTRDASESQTETEI